MVSKFLEKRVEIELEQFSTKPASLLELEYYLVETEVNSSEEKEAHLTYGVEIVKRHQGILNEKMKYSDLFQSKERTQNLINLLVRNTVTPIALPYVLDDFLGM